MKSKNSLIFIGLFIFGCQEPKEGDIIESEVTKISSRENCELTVIEKQKSTTNDKLSISFNCDDKDDFFPGKIMLEVYESLIDENIKREFYSIENKKKKIENYDSVSFDDLQRIRKVKKRFDTHFELLKNLDKVKLAELIDNQLKSEVVNTEWYNDMFKNLKNNRQKWNFNGFGMNKIDSGTYLIFANKLDEEVIIYFTYLFIKDKSFVDDPHIYGLGIIPLN
jgi:hypothetical protein